MGTALVSFTDSEESLLTSFAAKRGTTLDDIIAQFGVKGAIHQALQEELQAVVAEGSVKSDVSDLILKTNDWGLFWNAVSNAYNTNKFIPASLLTSAKARAAKGTK